jgi:glycosyltransferase involved in cell wall biosynthesis
MATGHPAVSVLLPVRNGLPYLPRAVESVLAQTESNLELIVVDDGSSDGTPAYLRTLGDPRIRVIHTSGQGLAAALNAGLGAARAVYVARHDADDWSAECRLERQLAWLTSHPDVDVLATSVDFVDAYGARLDSAWTRRVHEQWDEACTPGEIARLMPLTCCIFHATVMARTHVLRAAGGYDQAMVPAEDYDLWLRLLPRHRFARLSARLYTVRVHDESSSARRRTDQTARVVAAKLRFLRRQVSDLPWPSQLALPCGRDRGAAVFSQVAQAEGFELNGVDWRTADVVAVTDFAAVPRYAELLGDRLQFGNLFVRAG